MYMYIYTTWSFFANHSNIILKLPTVLLVIQTSKLKIGYATAVSGVTSVMVDRNCKVHLRPKNPLMSACAVTAVPTAQYSHPALQSPQPSTHTQHGYGCSCRPHVAHLRLTRFEGSPLRGLNCTYTVSQTGTLLLLLLLLLLFSGSLFHHTCVVDPDMDHQ